MLVCPTYELGLLAVQKFLHSVQICLHKSHFVKLFHGTCWVRPYGLTRRTCQNPQKKGSFFQTSHISPFLRIFTLHLSYKCLALIFDTLSCHNTHIKVVFNRLHFSNQMCQCNKLRMSISACKHNF